jgi:hypothetical protein
VVCVTGGRGQSGAGGKLALTPYNQDRVRVLMVRFVADDVRKVGGRGGGYPNNRWRGVRP